MVLIIILTDFGNILYQNISFVYAVEAGNEDHTVESIKEYRKDWFEKGKKWFNGSLKSNTWNFLEQLKNIPEKYK